MDKLSKVMAKIWLGLVVATVLGILWLSIPYLSSAYYLDRGTQQLTGESTQAAIASLETALRFEPDNALAYRRLAKAHLQLDKPELALQAAQQALQLTPHNPLVQLELGDVYDRLGDIEQTILHYKVGGVGNRKEQLAVNYLQLADQLWTDGDQEDAIAIWQDKVLGSDYGDLYANWRLAQYYYDDEEAARPYQDGVRYFLLDSIIVPLDHQLDKYQAQAFVGAVADGLWTRETLLSVIAYRLWQDQSQTTEDLLQSLLAENPTDADLHFYLGEVYRQRGDWQQAEAVYRQVLDLDAGHMPAYLRLGMVSEARLMNGEGDEWLSQAQTWYKKYHELAPEDPLGLKKLADLCVLSQCNENIWLTQLEDYLTGREPEFVVNQELDGWLFLGYDVDETRLVRAEPVALWLYWQAPANLGPIPDSNNTYQLGQRQVQVLENAQNLVINGGFEAGRAPSGFPNDIYEAALERRTVVTEIRNGQTTQAALLSNSKDFPATSFVTEYFPVEQNNYYLQAGWLKSEEGNGYLGRQWAGDLRKEVRPYTYVVSSVRPEQWTHYAAIIRPDKGASEAQVWLLNYQSEGKVYFDNILFMEIGRLNYLQ